MENPKSTLQELKLEIAQSSKSTKEYEERLKHLLSLCPDSIFRANDEKT